MSIKVIKTVKNTKDRLCEKASIPFTVDDDKIESSLLMLFPEILYQEIEGFGGAFTEAASTTLDKMSPKKRKEIIKAYFDQKDGIGYSFCRTHINSCDFSLGNYSYVEQGDKTLETFNISRDKRSLIPMIKEALAYGGFKLFASPWSPPAYMKDSGQMNQGGKLLPEYFEQWADYYVKYLQEYQKEGIDIWGVTVQNEPRATQTWDSCIYTAEEERDFIKNYLGKKLEAIGKKIMIWDHNKERLLERASVVLDDPEAAKYVYGTAFHWYSGDHFEQIRMLSEKYPDKKLIFSEGCVEAGPHLDNNWGIGERYAHDIIGDLNNGCHAFTDWNLVLNEMGGPNHVGNFCDAPIIADTETDEIIYEISYYYIGHFSKYIRPGAKRIGLSRYTDKLEACAFKNADGSIVTVVMNSSDTELSFHLKVQGKLAKISCEAHSITTLIFNN